MTKPTVGALPAVVDRLIWHAASTVGVCGRRPPPVRLDAIAAQRRRLPMVDLPDILPWGRQEEWQDSPDGWPKSPTYSKWLDSPDVARLYGPNGDES